MSNLEQGLNNNIALLENTLSKKSILNIYGNLKVLEYRAITEKENESGVVDLVKEHIKAKFYFLIDIKYYISIIISENTLNNSNDVLAKNIS